MPYFQVLLSVEPEPEKLVVLFSDLSESELNARFVKPYARGADLVSGNHIYRLQSIRRVHVVKTEKPDREERDALHDRSIRETEDLNRSSSGLVFLSLGRGSDPEDILEVGADVTAEFITGPPGHSHRPGVLGQILGNQWVMTICTGLLVAFLVWWFKWQ
jgi:hypothetical protein